MTDIESEKFPLPNAIAAFRNTKSLTITQLAEKAGITAQMLYEIETRRKAAPAFVALKICQVLEKNLEEVFPATKPILKAAQKDGNARAALSDSQYTEDMLDAGVDTGPPACSLAYWLRGGASGVFPISGAAYRELPDELYRSDDTDPCVVFDTERMHVVIRLDHLLASHLLFDALGHEPKQDEEDLGNVVVHLTSAPDPLFFEVEGDRALTYGPSAKKAEPMDVQMQNLVTNILFTDDPASVLTFVDANGERVFIRLGDLAMIQVPLWALDPDWAFFDEDEEDDDESAETPDRSTQH